MKIYSVGVTFLDEDEDPIICHGGMWQIDESGALIIEPVYDPKEDKWSKLQVFASGAWIWFEMEVQSPEGEE